MANSSLSAIIALGSAALLAAFFNPGTAQAFDVPVDVTIGHTATVPLDRAINTISIGDTAVVETAVASRRTLLIVGKAVGSTNIIPLDDAGIEIRNVKVRVMPSEPAQLIGHPIDIYGITRQSLICHPTSCVDVPSDVAVSGSGSSARRNAVDEQPSKKDELRAVSGAKLSGDAPQ